MLDLEKVGLNGNFPLHLHCPILQNNLGFTMVSKKGDRKTQGKNGEEEAVGNVLFLLHAPITPVHFGSACPQPLSLHSLVFIIRAR